MNENIFKLIIRKRRRIVKKYSFIVYSFLKLIVNWSIGSSYARNNREWLQKKTKPKYSIIVPTFKRIGALIDAVKTIRKYTSDYEIIIVNSGSGFLGDRWIEKQRKTGDTIVILDNGRRFGKRVMSQSYFYNLGYKAANGKYVIHFADDCMATPNWLNEATVILENDEMVGLALFFGQPAKYGEHQHTLYKGKLNGVDFYYPIAHWFCGRKADLEKIGFMNEEYNYYCNDLDMTVRVIHILNQKVICCSESKLIHKDKELVFRQKNAGEGDFDYFNKIWKEKVGFDSYDHVTCLIGDEFNENRSKYSV